jgi:hypothetical protein
MSSSGAAIVPRRCDADETASQLDVDVYPDEYRIELIDGSGK